MRHSSIVCLLALAASVAGAQAASVKETFESYNLLGTFAWDCGKPASKQNHFFVHRAIDANHVQRDMMDSPTARGFLVIVDKATPSKPNSTVAWFNPCRSKKQWLPVRFDVSICVRLTIVR